MSVIHVKLLVDGMATLISWTVGWTWATCVWTGISPIDTTCLLAGYLGASFPTLRLHLDCTTFIWMIHPHTFDNMGNKTLYTLTLQDRPFSTCLSGPLMSINSLAFRRLLPSPTFEPHAYNTPHEC
ncbi:hypothetical protein BJ912DRAFT_123632 [Pholiota molesta]|nr:hypothetical protein BJ912DRAFT_123632 [Pholiota molesta]